MVRATPKQCKWYPFFPAESDASLTQSYIFTNKACYHYEPRTRPGL